MQPYVNHLHDNGEYKRAAFLLIGRTLTSKFKAKFKMSVSLKVAADEPSDDSNKTTAAAAKAAAAVDACKGRGSLQVSRSGTSSNSKHGQLMQSTSSLLSSG